MQAGIAETVGRASRALGLADGPIHAECRLTPDGRIYVLEVAARPIGGLCSRVLTFEAADAEAEKGPSLEAILLRHAIGEDVATAVRESRGAAVMMIPIARRGILKGVAGEEAARAVTGVTDVRITAKLGQLLEPLPEAGSYLGFIFARDTAAGSAVAAVRAAHQRLAFDVARELPVTTDKTE